MKTSFFLQSYMIIFFSYVVIFLQTISYTSLSMCVLHVDGQSCSNINDAMEERAGICTSSLYTIKWSKCTSSGTSRQAVKHNTGTWHQRQSKDFEIFSTHVNN